MKNPEQTGTKRSKAKDPNCGQVVIIESPKGHYSDFTRKVKPKNLKCLVKEMTSERPGQKKKQRDAESKKDVRANSIVVIDSGSESESLRNTKKRNKVSKKEKVQKLFSKNSEGLDGIDCHPSKKCDKSVLKVEKRDEEPVMKRKKKKKEKRKEKPTGLDLYQEMRSGQKKSRTHGQKVTGKKRQKKPLDYRKGDQENSILKEAIAQSMCAGLRRWEDLACRPEKGGESVKEEEKTISIASLSSLARIQENCCNIMSEYSLNCGFKKGMGVCQAPKEVHKAAKKEAKKKTRDRSHFAEAGQDLLSEVGAAGGKERRKKAKKHKVERDDARRDEGRREQIKKKKKKEIKNSQDNKKKAKKKKEIKLRLELTRPLEPEDEVKLVAFREGNCDEVNIDKMRRQALQEEIDRESGKTKTAKEELDNRLGQWSTASFETPEQEAKFHRLLGGFKKDSAPGQRSLADAKKSNMALDQPREQELQQKLEAEFKKAMEFKQHRGVGLGFRSGAPGGAHIDKHASKSIKFED